MIRKLLLLLLTVGMLAKHSGGGGDHSSGNRPGETDQERMQREMDEMWGDHGGSSGGRGSSTTLEEAFANVDNELDQSDNSVNSPTDKDGDGDDDGGEPWRDPWPKPDERPSAWDADEGAQAQWDRMTNVGGIGQGTRDHIIDGDEHGGGHLSGTGKPDKTEFPPDWDEPEILKNVQDAARNPDSVVPRSGGGDKGYEAHKQIDGVDIVVYLNRDGSVSSAHPTGGRDVHTNPPAKK